MKRTLILTVCVLAASLALCAVGMAALNASVDEARRLCSLAVLSEADGDTEAAQTAMSRLAGLWQERRGVMEMLAEHDALHEVSSAIADARICLERGDGDEFLRAMTLLNLALNHLRDEQALRWENLY